MRKNSIRTHDECLGYNATKIFTQPVILEIFSLNFVFFLSPSKPLNGKILYLTLKYNLQNLVLLVMFTNYV